MAPPCPHCSAPKGYAFRYRRTYAIVFSLIVLLQFLVIFLIFQFWIDVADKTDGACDTHCRGMLLFDSLKRTVYALTFGIIGGCTSWTGNCYYWFLIGRDMPQCERHHMYELLRHTKKVFNEENIVWWLTSGTLIGAVRHGDLIPWDFDVDVCVYVPGRNRTKLARALSTMEQRYGHTRAGKSWTLLYSRSNRVQMDFFDCYPVDGWHSHWLTKNKTFETELYNKNLNMFGKGHTLMHSSDSANAVNTPISVFLPVQDCVMGTELYPCPANPVQSLLTDIFWTPYPLVKDNSVKIRTLVEPKYNKCLANCPRRDKKQDTENIKGAICRLHRAGWPSMFDLLVMKYGPDVCDAYQDDSWFGLDLLPKRLSSNSQAKHKLRSKQAE